MYNKFIVLFFTISTSIFQSFGFELLNTNDFVYSEKLKTVQLYANTNSDNTEINPAVISLNSGAFLTLEFDELGDDVSSYSATIINCTWDWKTSTQSDLDFLDEYNEFSISDIERSANTKINYTHYRFNIPKISISGNYVLVIYNDIDAEKPSIVKRFSVYEGSMQVNKNNLSSFITATSSKQMLNFDVQVTPQAMTNPLGSIKVVIRQNGRWDKYLGNIKPSFMDIGENKLSYQFLNESEIFDGRNKFRVIDIRSSLVTGREIRTQDYFADTSYAYTFEQKDRSRNVHSSDQDINGQFVIDNYEFGDGDIESDYVNTHFALKTYTRSGRVYVFGALTNWKVSPDFELKYNEKKKIYDGVSLIKQGYYNYIFVQKDRAAIDETIFEGSFNQTENTYEVFVYYQEPGQFSEILAGYRLFRVNKY